MFLLRSDDGNLGSKHMYMYVLVHVPTGQIYMIYD